ncbi:hypothetical protein TARUN_6814 [Trichoderma arundinaceum]|uniref:Uncharacterized protein n=1 Tax=Trichoderma arundinaceum TaxID=490622 RepID=A0A395NHP3_TRIAR|nr:hypothetical protein TARUN_6814 [Trichoderma arundinaceum]
MAAGFLSLAFYPFLLPASSAARVAERKEKKQADCKQQEMLPAARESRSQSQEQQDRGAGTCMKLGTIYAVQLQISALVHTYASNGRWRANDGVVVQLSPSVPRQLGQLRSARARYYGLFLIVLRLPD